MERRFAPFIFFVDLICIFWFYTISLNPANYKQEKIKMETWHIRHGSVEFFGEYKGEAGETLIADMAECDKPWGYGEKWFKSKYVKKLGAGEIYSLNDPESFHFMRAGKNGAIVAEYATYHNDVKFSNPEMQFGNSEAEKITKLKK